MSTGEKGDDHADRILREEFTNDFRTGYITVQGVCLPLRYRSFSDALENFEVRDDDVWVCSFPKTGTTWTQEMVWCIANDLDFEGAKVVLSERFPFLDVSILFDYSEIIPRTPGLEFSDLILNSVSFVNNLPSPRFIKCHLPFDLLPRQIREGTKKPKIIYVARNPKDTCISYFNHCKLLEGYRGNFQDFCTLFLAGKLCYAPFWKHILGFWNRRDWENILFIKYEDMKTDLGSVIRETADFLGKSESGIYKKGADNNKTMETLLNHLSFSSMKVNPAVNYEEVIDNNKKFLLSDTDGKFMRSGESNQWKGIMSHDMIETFNKWTSENLQDSGLVF